MGKRLALVVFALVPVMVVTGVSSAATTGGGTVLSPPQGSVVAKAGIPVRVRLDANTGLVGTEAAVLTIAGWIAPTDQPATPDNYSIFTITATTFTVHAMPPPTTGKYTIRINRDQAHDNGEIAQVHVVFRRFAVFRFRATPRTTGGCTHLSWRQTVRGRAWLVVKDHGRVPLGMRHAGRNHDSWCGRVNGHRLANGAYRLWIRARDFLNVRTTRSRGLTLTLV